MRLLNLLAHLIITGVTLWVTAQLLPGMHLGDDASSLQEQILTIGAIALVFVVIDVVVKPVISLISLPLTCVTFGLFQLVINALMLMLVAWVSGQFGLTLSFDSFWWAFIAGVIIGVLRAVTDAVIQPAPPQPRTRVLYERTAPGGATTHPGENAVFDQQGRRLN